MPTFLALDDLVNPSRRNSEPERNLFLHASGPINPQYPTTAVEGLLCPSDILGDHILPVARVCHCAASAVPATRTK